MVCIRICIVSQKLAITAITAHINYESGEGGRGKFARWKLEVHGKNLVKFKSTKSGKYLRIINNGKACDVGGGGGIYTLFRYDPQSKTLESNKFAGAYLAVMKQKNKSQIVSVRKASSNNANYLYQFNIIYLHLPSDIQKTETVVIRHGISRYFRVDPQAETQINGTCTHLH